ncbi:MAG TPA: ribonuclease P protein component 4 [Candidatus Nanoarchaeia archaeon]|nr:ribonuclease P protein component 4 [Candidatus Nanoarchaeia archaeon]
MIKKLTKPEAQKAVIDLLSLAEKQFATNPDKAHLYVKKARRIAMKHKLRLPAQLKKKFCKHCYHFLQPGTNARIRIHASKIVITCWDCKHITRIPIK